MKEAIHTDHAPKALGPYSQAIRHGQMVFCSGQVAIDAATGSVVAGGIEEQTHQVLKNQAAVLAAAGCSLADVVKTTVFLTDMNEFAAMNKVYGEYFPAPFPGRSTVQVVRLPKDVKVEIEVIAVKP
ncbi:MAG: RidA family protein [Candidatus Aminicenantes bacterium]|nr:RidA family protein [Candidatus Aminicenantes bacterium]